MFTQFFAEMRQQIAADITGILCIVYICCWRSVATTTNTLSERTSLVHSTSSTFVNRILAKYASYDTRYDVNG